MTGAPFRTRWTTERDDRMHALLAEKMSPREIGVEMGITRNAVIGRMNRLRVKSQYDDPRYGRLHRSNGAHQDRSTTQRIRAKRRVTRRASDPQQGTMTLVELENCHCRWPMNDGSPYLFCGAPEADMRGRIPYCLDHSRMAGAGYSRDRSYGFNRSANTFR